jgi:hypothetical protein
MEMRKFGYFVLFALLPLVAACDSVPEDYRVPAQSFARPIEGTDGADGKLYGQILFPAEYNQRSVVFELGGRQFVTHPDGRFLVEDVPAGEHVLRIRVKAYEPVLRRIEVPSEEAVAAGEVRLKMARGKVVGRLVSEKGSSAASVTVRLTPLGDAVTTDQDGIFQFIAVNAGDHELLVTDEQFFTYNRKFRIERGEQRNLGNIQVFRRATASISRTAVLTQRRAVSPVSTEKAE